MAPPIDTAFDAFAASYRARAAAEAQMFQSTLDPWAPPDMASVRAVQIERRREIFCLRALLHLSDGVVQQARRLTRNLPSK